MLKALCKYRSYLRHTPRITRFQDWGLLGKQTTEDEEVLAENARWYRRLISEGKGGSIALAFLCTKALVPIKIPIAMSLTPVVHRWLRSMGIVKLQTSLKNP